ncbi:hypothetical protein M5K25_015935 [Dendrobium thyrsiflorum]|uniref:Uncharacterized protein n=2 Tax=Magnoliopsida TaxID=3398 RepID=A0ABD0USB9_DENTH
MLGAALLALDLSALLQFACSFLVILIAGVFFVTRKKAPRSSVVDAALQCNEEFQGHHHMPIGRGGSDAVGVGASECPVCTRSASKKCSRCKSVWYCSQECQSKHWKAEHKSKCREVGSPNKFDTCGTGSRRISSAISLVPDHGTRKVLKEPKKILFPYDEFVKLFDWDKPGFPPCGLLNCGNSCFANVVLQCLACTRPLVAYLLEKNHNRGCLRSRDDWCFLCELQAHIKRASESSQSFSPINILSRLPNIGGNLGYGRQEDAHEFMRFAIDTMQSICLDEYGGEKAVDPSTQETTIVQYIFGGHLRSQVICTNCDVVSNRYENMMDLTVEIHGDSESLEECLDQFTVKEWLDGENMYKCDGCNGYVTAWKRLTVHQAPNVLTIALKRFQSGRFGKLNKRVTFPENLDLTPYMSSSGDGTDHYTLYGVVVHLDMLNASFFGHYICYIKNYQGLWYKIDDCKVVKVEVEEVLAQGAYMLLYRRRNPRKDPFVKPVEPPTNAHLAETDPTTSSAACSVFSMPLEAEPQPNILHSQTLSEFSTLRDTGHDRELVECSGNESEDMDLYALGTNKLVPKSAENFGIDNSFANPSEVNGVKLENSNCLENSSIKSIMPSKASNPANFSLAEIEATEFEELNSYSDAHLHKEEGNVSVNVKVIPELSSTDNDIIMAEASTALIPTSSIDQGPRLALSPQPEPRAIIYDSSGLVNGICTSEMHTEISMDSSRVKMKPIFTRGFFDKPVRKKPSERELTVSMDNQGTPLSYKANSHSNGHLQFGRDIKMASGNVNGETISPDSNVTSISPSSSNGCSRDHSEVECNGVASFYENEINEFGQELPCSSFETSAETRNSPSNGDDFLFKMDVALPSYGSDIKTPKSKTSECCRDENQRSRPLNGFSTADFSD